MGSIRLALVQSESTLGTESFDPRKDNLERAISAIRDVKREGAELVVFGEMYLTGYRTDEWLTKWASMVDPPDADISALVAEAKRQDIHIIIGAATYGGFIPGDVYNSAIVIGPTGVLGVYRKTHVASFPYSGKISEEGCFYSPGYELPVFDTPLGRIGVHICYDIAFPEVSRVQALKGAELLINVSASVDAFKEWWTHNLYVRAVENASWYAICSVVGEQRGDILFGGSRVVDPTGTVIVEGKHNEEDVLIVDVDLEQAREQRATTHAFSIRQPALYAPIAEPKPYP